MAQCFACSKALQGSWNMTGAGTNYDRTGRYLDINDGYFLYSGQPNWVYCYCQSFWENQIASLPCVSSKLNDLQQQNTALQQQLVASQAESASYKKKLDEMTENFQKLANNSEIEKLRNLFKQLTASQMDALHTHTNFRVDSCETVHCEQQLQCSLQFVQSSLEQLRSIARFKKKGGWVFLE